MKTNGPNFYAIPTLLLLASLCLITGTNLGAATTAARNTPVWAFNVPEKISPPILVDDRLARNPIDAFIQARLQKEGLTPSPEADKRTLLRRVFFDLTGLPPTPAEARDFLTDASPGAYEELVDRLLASPRYGERWARYWLDIVHYGESHGYDKDKPRPNAWPYRDYVIHAFNDDKPYWRFVQEQVAGDILFPGDPEATVATGFIASGPWDFVGHVELPESKTDGLIARYNDRDDMVMTTMSTFLSLTVHCARCHDHKFDPIAQRDYYGLQAVFAGVDRADRPFDEDAKTFARRKEWLAQKQGLAREQDGIQKAVRELTTPELARLDVEIAGLKKDVDSLPKLALQSPSNGYHSGIEAAPDVEKWVQIDLGQSTEVERIVLIPARPTDFADTPGFGFPARFRVEGSDDAAFSQRTVFLDATGEDYKNPGDAAVTIPAQKQTRFIRVTTTRLWERSKDFVFALAELEAFSKGTNAAVGKAVSALDSIDSGRWQKAYLVDNYDSRKPLQLTPENRDLAERRERSEARLKAARDQRDELMEKSLPPATKEKRDEIKEALKAVEANLKTLPMPHLVYAAANDFAPSGNFHPPVPPRLVHLLARGDVKSPKEIMSAGAVGGIRSLPPSFTLPVDANDAERRSSLANWLTRTNNFLLRRSIVNRVWQYHFGRGIIDTPNDFGHMGSPPSHPELLDWLAQWFVENGESMKKLHKLILMSHAYRQSSSASAELNQLDSENRLLARMNRTRLDAENVRDSVLQLSGKLDLRMGGPSDQQFFFKDDHSPTYDYSKFDVSSTNACRRGVYRFIVRSVPDPFMDSLDCADPSLLVPKRNNTLTALQALSTLNNAFILRQAEFFATRLASEKNDTPGQVKLAFDLALNRQPTEQELTKLSRFAEDEGLANFCRLLFNLNEFVFLD